MSSRLLALALAAPASLLAASAAQAQVVVSSSGPSAQQYPVGTRTGETERINLRAGDVVTVLSDNGTRVFRGPGSFVIRGGGAGDKRSTFAALTQTRPGVRARTGASRTGSADILPTPQSVWSIDISRPGTFCLPPESTSLSFWRPEFDGDLALQLSDPDGAAMGEAMFSDGQTFSVTRLEMAVPQEGTSLTLSSADEGEGRQFDLRVLETVPGTPEELALALIERECATQLDTLAAALEDE